MPTYSYICDACNTVSEIIKPMSRSNDTEACSICKAVVRRHYQSDVPNTGNLEYAKPVISESLGIHPEQTKEHRENFPDVEVMPEGQLRFDNYQAHNKYLKKIGWDKQSTRKEI